MREKRNGESEDVRLEWRGRGRHRRQRRNWARNRARLCRVGRVRRDPRAQRREKSRRGRGAGQGGGECDGGPTRRDAARRAGADDWDRVIETNLNSCFFLSQIAARSMVAHRHGKIINIASEYSHFGSQSGIAYPAAKGALVQTTKTMAIELAPHNVQVNAIVPGWIETDMTVGAQSGPMFNEIIMRTPAGRFGKPEEMAGAAVFLASHASDFVTGSIVHVDGGYAIR